MKVILDFLPYQYVGPQEIQPAIIIWRLVNIVQIFTEYIPLLKRFILLNFCLVVALVCFLGVKKGLIIDYVAIAFLGMNISCSIICLTVISVIMNKLVKKEIKNLETINEIFNMHNFEVTNLDEAPNDREQQQPNQK